MQTDIHGTATTFHLFKLAAFSLGRPVRQVKFQANQNVIIGNGSYVVATAKNISDTVNDFLHGNAPVTVHVPALNLKRKNEAKRLSGLGLIADAPSRTSAWRTSASVGLPIKLYVPRLRLQSAPPPDVVRAYTLPDEQDVKHKAYVISIARGLIGEYYGVEGTDWMTPADPRRRRTRRREDRRPDLHALHRRQPHPHRLLALRPRRLLAQQHPRDSLTNQQMLAIAESARPIN